MKNLIPVLLGALLFIRTSACAQQPPPPPPPDASTSAPPQPATPPTSSKKAKPIPSFLIIGTVFDERALSLPGVQVLIRQAGERKFRWETYTNSRGEFAVRVPPGCEYEVVTHMKHYQERSETVDAKEDVQKRLSIKLEPRSQSKTGAKS